MRIWIFLMFFFLLSFYLNNNSFSHTTMIVDKTCPICSTQFEAEIDASGYKNDMRLDLKPLGEIAAPFRIPVCPTCNFVLYTNDFDEDTLKIFTNYVYSDEYKNFADYHSSYFLIGKLFEEIRAKPSTIAYIYLKASWQVEENDTKRYKQYLELSLQFYNDHLNQITADDKSWLETQIISSEIERLLGKYEDAEKRLTALKQQYQNDPNEFIFKVISFEIDLVKNKDSDPHTMSEIRKK